MSRDEEAAKGARAGAGREANDAEALADALEPALYAEFRAGGEEHVAAAEGALLALERRADDREALDSAFRAIHSLKGDAGCLGLAAIAHVAHAAEGPLSQAREGDLAVAGPLADALLHALDVIRRAIGATGDAPAPEVPPEALAAAASLESAAKRASSLALNPLEPTPAEVAAMDAPLGSFCRPSPGPAPSTPASPVAEGRAVGARDDVHEEAAASDLADAARPTVRVDLSRLDALLDLIGELVICQSQAAEHPEMQRPQEDALGRELVRLSKLVEEVQRTALSLRMVPIRALFQKMHRVARDAARRSGKKVELVTRGEATELDRGVLAELADPLVHLVRNAVDHGIEKPAARRAAGKPETARLVLDAHAKSGFVHVDISDDGRGIDVERVRDKAVERGLHAAGAPLDEDRAIGLIFAPGFTTQDTVSEISGRGVGLDVVRARLDRLHGHVSVSTLRGKGATFSLRLPLTLSVLEGMVVSVGGERCVVPTSSIVQAALLDPQETATILGRGETVRFRGAALPMVRLERAIGAAPTSPPPAQPMIVIVEVPGRRAALLVDEVIGQRQVVVKPLGERLRSLPGILGGTVLGDGRVGLILDMDGIVPKSANERAASAA